MTVAADIPSWVIEASKSLGNIIEYVDSNPPDKDSTKKRFLKRLFYTLFFMALPVLWVLSFDNRLNGLLCLGTVAVLVIISSLYYKAKKIKDATRCAVYIKGIAFGSLSNQKFTWDQFDFINHWHYESIDDADRDIFTIVLKEGGEWELDNRVLGSKAQALAQLISQTGNIPIKPNNQQKNTGLKF